MTATSPSGHRQPDTPTGRDAGHAALVGPTASGKSGLAFAIACDDPSWELVSVDSMQVYRGMDIGTAKPTPAERSAVSHHLLDLAEPWEDFDVAAYQAAAHAALADIEARGKRALLVGGTGLYLRAVVDDLTLPGRYPEVRAELEHAPDTEGLHARLAELDPAAAARMEPSNRRRIVRALEVTLGSGRPFSTFGPGLDTHPPIGFRLVGLRRDRRVLDERIHRRYEQQLADGFVEEVEALLHGPRPWSRSASQALGYKELASHLAGACSLEEAVDLAVRRTRRFARRQERWFRRDPRIRWVGVDDDVTDVGEAVRRLLAAPPQ